MNLNISSKKQLKAESVFTSQELEDYFDRLYPICRSILGNGFRSSLEILRELIPFECYDTPSGAQVLDWIIPDEWDCRDAFIIKPDGEKLADFKERNIRVVQYSTPVNASMSLEELKPHLHTLPDMVDHFPYVASYYKRQWGFCLTQKEYDALEEGTYKVVIKSTIKPGFLRYGQTILKGKTDNEILLSTYLCHPQMANHELSGPLAMAILYRMLKASGPHKFSYRFVIIPENIGSATLLHQHGDRLVEKVHAGFVLNCLGHGKKWTYKMSRRANSKSDLAALNQLKFKQGDLDVIPFFPDGSDERQYCSPGFNLPIGLVMRYMYGQFPEYHTSADDKSLISFETLLESAQAYFDIMMTLELDFTPQARILRGTPMLSRSPISLYRDTMNFRSHAKTESTRVMLEILNLAEGNLSLLEMAQLKNFDLLLHSELIEDLVKSGYIADQS